jgi:DNA-binding NarL/FixJ family response regulator
MRKPLLLADDHPLILEGLTRLLANEFEIVGTANNGRVLIEMAEQLKPSLIVLDIGMPGLNGIEAARCLNKLLPATKLIFITQHLNRAYARAAFAAGAKAYVAKQSASEELIEAIHCAAQNRYFVTRLLGTSADELGALTSNQNPSELLGSRLTPRQREVLQLVAEGRSTKEISTALNISQKTVEFHRNGLMDELGVRTIAELTRYAVSQGIVT